MAYIDGIPATSLDKADREWVKNVASEMGGGGTSGMIITITESDTYTADKTFSEIYTAITSGTVPVVKYLNYFYKLLYADNENIDFSLVGVASNSVNEGIFTIHSDNTIEFVVMPYPDQ